MKREELTAGLAKNAGVLNYAIPMAALQAIGSKAQSAFGEAQDLESPEGRLDNQKEDLKWRGVGLLAGVAAGLVLNRHAGKMKSFRLFRG